MAGCQCPNGQLLNDKNRCVPVAQCCCQYEGQTIQPGESVSVGNCKTWYVIFKWDYQRRVHAEEMGDANYSNFSLSLGFIHNFYLLLNGMRIFENMM